MGGRERLCFRLDLVRGCEINRGVRALGFSRRADAPASQSSVSQVQIYHPDVTGVVFLQHFSEKPKAFAVCSCQNSTAARSEKRAGSVSVEISGIAEETCSGPQLHLE